MAAPGAIRALLVDDEMLAIRRLSRSLERIEGVELVASTTSAREAVGLIEAENPDMIFVDIAMPGLTGFEVIERMAPATRPAIVFVTAHDEYAVQAYGIAAVDYLLKPVAQARLEESVDRGRLWLEARSARPPVPPSEPRRGIDSLWVHRHREFLRVPVEEIDWIEGHGDYARIRGRQSAGLVRTTLAALEDRLDPAQFIRTHRSAICRKAAIVSLRRKPSGAMTVLLANGEEAPVGRTFVPGLRALVKTMGG
jgi:two-component system response regulator AlgR